MKEHLFILTFSSKFKMKGWRVSSRYESRYYENKCITNLINNYKFVFPKFGVEWVIKNEN